MITRAIVAALLLSLCAGQALARSERYTFDRVHSQIEFRVSHIGFSMSAGEFHEWDGAFNFDPDNWTTASVEVTIDAASLDMDNGPWNRALLGRKYFNVAEHPKLRFVSTGLKKTGAASGVLEGTLTLLGISRPVALDVIFNRVGVHPYSGLHVAGFSASTRIKRSDFGMREALPAVGDDVEIRLEIEGVRSARTRSK